MNNARYRFDAGQHSGGFGSVQEVHDTYLERDVFFKTMHDPENNQQIENEIICLTRARSPHIIEIYDVAKDQEDNLTGIFIEKLTGRDYLQFYKEANHNPEKYLKLIYQIASALADLHLADIVHRDLKLDNFKEAQSGILKLFDFGISSHQANYVTRQNRGTLVYAAPELYTQAVEINSAIDVYALGICCWKLATDKLPPQLHETPPQKSQKAPSIRHTANFIPEDMAELIDLSISPAPENRPTAVAIRDLAQSLLVKDKHYGKLVSTSNNNLIYELSATSPNVRLNLSSLGEFRAAYTGTQFKVTGVTGDVYINNIPATAGMILEDACVLTFGSFDQGPQRAYFSFICSKPEIVL